MNKKKNLKMYVVRKYIMASSAKEALKKEIRTPADDCWIDEEWKKGGGGTLESAIGFSVEK